MRSFNDISEKHLSDEFQFLLKLLSALRFVKMSPHRWRSVKCHLGSIECDSKCNENLQNDVNNAVNR